MTKQSWYKILAEHRGGDSHAEILIYDEIGRNFWGEGISADELVKELSALDVATLDVRINSVGGEVFEGLAIFNALDRHPAKVTTHIDGMAASIASIVALAGEEVFIAENAFMMIHNAWGIEIGDAKAMLKRAEILDTLDGGLADTYMAKTGESEKSIRAMMDVETWFNAEEALAVGLVDEISAKMEIAASFNFDRFRNVRDDVLERAAEQIRPMGKLSVGIETMTPAIEAGLEAVAAGTDPDPAGPSPEELLELSIQTSRTLADTRP